jgi:hypothetical protein
MRAMENEEDESLRDWLNELGGESELKVNIARKKPLMGAHGEIISGSLETVDGRVDEDYIRETWGGGEFLLKVYTPQGPNGSLKYRKGRTIKIAGPPKMNGTAVNGAQIAIPIAHEDDSLATRAFETMERNQERERQRADRIEQQAANAARQSSGLDVEAMREMNKPFLEQLRVLQEANGRLQLQVMEMSSKPPPRDEFRDRLMERAIEGESARIEALRAQYEIRIDKLRDSHEDQIKRLEDRQADEIKRLEARHEREIVTSGRSIESLSKNQDIAFSARLDALKSDNARLERELTAAATKIAGLEARKDQTIGEKADELIKVKEALDGIGGGDGSDDKWYEKVINAVGNSEAAVNFLGKITGGAPAAPAQPQPQLPPPGVPFSTGDGNVYVRSPDGTVSIVDQAALRQQRALAAARQKKRKQQQQPPSTEGGDPIADGLADDAQPDAAPPVGRRPDATEMKLAITFMENAIRGGATPEAFGRTAAAMIPADILTYMHSVGIEKFLASAPIEQGSPLTSIRGRQFARSVAKFLAEGSTGEPPPGT